MPKTSKPQPNNEPAEQPRYVVTARKWRPQTFEDIVGQQHVSRTLKNALATNRLSHSYLFSGPRGVGKTTTARILAKAINCLHPVDNNPDNTCELCQEITEGRSVNVFEIDGASNRSIDDIRSLREAVRYGPARGKYKVYIIDEVHMLTKEAFNALLKTLEEPPSYIVFIFATTEIHKVPATILSRCQRFDFRRNSIEEITGRLRFIAEQEHIAIDDDALLLIARRGDGSMRDSQSIFDQVVAFCGMEISAAQIASMLNIVDEEMYFRITDVIQQKDVKSGLAIVEEVVTKGFDLREFLNGLIEHLRNLLVVKTTKSTHLLEASEQTKKRSMELAQHFSENDLLRLIKIASDTESQLRFAAQPRYKLEVGLIQMITMDSSVQIGELLREIAELKKNGADSRPANGQTRPSIKDISPSFAQADEPSRPVIQGSVKATQPQLRPDQIVSIPPLSILAGESSKLYSATEQTSPTLTTTSRALQFQPSSDNSIISGMAKLSPEEATGKWMEFVEQARHQRIAVGTMLSESRLVGVEGNSLQIGCPDDFHLDALRRHRQFLHDLAERIYGAKVRLEAMLSSAPAMASAPPAVSTASVPILSTIMVDEVPPAVVEQTVHPLIDDIRSHPVVKALIEQFGAREIE